MVNASFALKNISVRRAKASDLDDIVRIELASFITPWSRELLREELFFPLSMNMAALVDDILRGYIFTWLIPPEVHILNLAIDPAFRRKGIGKRLVEELFNEAKKNGGTRFTLEVRAGNIGTINFYQKFKFVTKGVRKGYYQDTGEDALIMWRDL